MSTISDRFEVGDDVCGCITHFPRKADAIREAQDHRRGHRRNNVPCTVFVYDRMARAGRPMIRFEARWDGADIYSSGEWRMQ